MQTTLNDVMLAICAGALRRYLSEKNSLPKSPLVAMVPISTRGKQDISVEGNQISSMLIQLATNIEDPIERLETIHENTIREKSYHGAIGAKTLANMAEAVPFGIANQAARLYSRYHISEWHNPVFNVTITNVPGPPMPLYLNGHKLLSVMGTAPIVDGMGLIITIFSYNGLLTVSSTSDANTMPDINVFSKYLLNSANELEKAVLAYRAKKKPTVKKNLKAKSDAVLVHIRSQLKEKAAFIKPNNGIFQLVVNADNPQLWKIDLNRSPGMVRRAKVQSPDVTLTIDDDHLYKIGTGALSFKTAFIQGRIEVNGDTEKAMKLGTILTKLPKLKS
jgi:putative sterol carrier protein